MKAGMDFGSTFTKAVWKTDDIYRFASTQETSLEAILHELKNSGITQLNVAGIRYTPKYALDFDVRTEEEDPIQNEIRLQAAGAQKLLELNGTPLDEFLLVSVGTGTSYTYVSKDAVRKFPIGNSIGGGFISGLSHVLEINDYKDFARYASEGQPLDTKIKDVLPVKEGTIEGEFVIANFGKATLSSSKKDICTSIVHAVAISTIKDVLVTGLIPDYATTQVVFVGSTIAANLTLKNMFAQYTRLIGRTPYFPTHGEFALAMGAYHVT